MGMIAGAAALIPAAVGGFVAAGTRDLGGAVFVVAIAGLAFLAGRLSR